MDKYSNKYMQGKYGPMHEDDVPEAAMMDPYTIQIIRRLEENEKILANITDRIYRLNDRLFGPMTLLSKSDQNSLGTPPVPKAIIEEIVGQVNIHNRRLNDLSEALNRLESL